MNAVRSCLLALSFLVACGCISHTFTPTVGTLDSGPGFSSTQSIQLENAQPSAAEVLVLTNWPHKWHANLQECTEAVRSMIESTLTGCGITIDASATKELRLSVERLETEVGFATIVTEAVLRAETSAGYTASFTGRGRAVMAGSVPKQCNDALRRAAQEMMKDPEIVAFLTR